jgi:hypothetical protein
MLGAAVLPKSSFSLRFLTALCIAETGFTKGIPPNLGDAEIFFQAKNNKSNRQLVKVF